MTPDDQHVTDEQLLAVIARSDADAVLDRDVADEVPLPIEDVADRLESLYERGDLELVEEDTRGRTWRLTDAVDREDLPSESETVTDVEGQTTGRDETEAPPDRAETAPSPETRPDEPAPISDDVADAVDAIDLPGSPEEAERRRESLRTAYLYLRKRGRADRDDFAADVHPEAPGDYADPSEGWWEDVIKPGLETLPDVEYDEDADAWVFTGDPDERP